MLLGTNYNTSWFFYGLQYEWCYVAKFLEAESLHYNYWYNHAELRLINLWKCLFGQVVAYAVIKIKPNWQSDTCEVNK